MSGVRPVLVFDGDCGFCRLWIARWREITGEKVEYVPAQGLSGRFPQLKPADLAEAVHLVEPDGRVSRGAEAVFRGLAAAGGVQRAWPALYRSLPPFRLASEAAYRVVAQHRPLFSRLTRLLWGSPVLPRLDGTRRALIAGIGLVYLVAFASLGVQVRGLIGRDGLMPAAQYLAAATQQLGAARWRMLPTLAWFSVSDRALIGMCAAGGIAALGMIFDLFAGASALACWTLYLSLSVVGSDFLGYQWDALLLETGLVALFLAPWNLPGRPRASVSRGALRLMRLLLLKLMLQSGMIKLLSHDSSWRNLTALAYHYWTQPLPTPLAWYANLLPMRVQKASCAAMFVVELGAPLLLLWPRRVRAAGAAAIAFLMVLVGLTGNYGFFNLLTLVLCLSALDDGFPLLARWAPKPEPRAPSRLRAPALAAFATVWLAVSGVLWALQAGVRPPLERVWAPVVSAQLPLRSINQYGLFAVMTTTRDEIVIEVSADGRDWKEWPFKWKPGDPRRAPPFVAPHMPRLDWQMWFASLGAPSPWFNNLIFRILTGGTDSPALVGPSPLGDAKPVYARASLWATRFSTPEERRADGSWWKRERKGLYFPVVSLKR